jgi:hypothetical protein
MNEEREISKDNSFFIMSSFVLQNYLLFKGRTILPGEYFSARSLNSPG